MNKFWWILYLFTFSCVKRLLGKTNNKNKKSKKILILRRINKTRTKNINAKKVVFSVQWTFLPNKFLVLHKQLHQRCLNKIISLYIKIKGSNLILYFWVDFKPISFKDIEFSLVYNNLNNLIYCSWFPIDSAHQYDPQTHGISR